MKILKVTEDYIEFNNGNRIGFDHDQDCCEYNYVDFNQLEECAFDYEFDEDLVFESVKENGFRFGNKQGYMFFLPCYLEQNGFYSDDVDIYYNGEKVLKVTAEEIFEY